MILSATSFVIPDLLVPLDDTRVGAGEGLRERSDFRSPADKWRSSDAGGSRPESAAAPCSATSTWSKGTCHVARYLHQE